MIKLLDANAILRFLLNDIPEQATAAANVIYEGAFTKEVVIAEVIYVLTGVYKLSRAEATTKTALLLELVDIENPDVIKTALNLFATTKLDFVDCVLIAYNKVLGTAIFSFDKKLNSKLSQ